MVKKIRYGLRMLGMFTAGSLVLLALSGCAAQCGKWGGFTEAEKKTMHEAEKKKFPKHCFLTPAELAEQQRKNRGAMAGAVGGAPFIIF